MKLLLSVNLLMKTVNIRAVLAFSDIMSSRSDLCGNINTLHCPAIRSHSQDIHQEYYKTIITHMDCMDCLAMPSSSSQTVILCIKHQEDEKSEPYIDRKITLEACIREQELDTDSDGEF